MKASIKQSGEREVTITIPAGHPLNLTDETATETYWIPATRSGWGYVRRGDKQVCTALGRLGDTLRATPETLLFTIRQHHAMRSRAA